MSSPYDAVIWRPVTIALGASLSDAVNTLGYEVVAIQQAADTEGTAFTFQASYDGSAFADVQDGAGNELSVTKSATAAQFLMLQEGVKAIRGATAVKVRSGTSASPTVQTGAAATVWVGTRRVA